MCCWPLSAFSGRADEWPLPPDAASMLHLVIDGRPDAQSITSPVMTVAPLDQHIVVEHESDHLAAAPRPPTIARCFMQAVAFNRPHSLPPANCSARWGWHPRPRPAIRRACPYTRALVAYPDVVFFVSFESCTGQTLPPDVRQTHCSTKASP